MTSRLQTEQSPYEIFGLTGALRITVTGTVFSTGFIVWILRYSTILVHGDKVEGSIETARKIRYVNIKCEFLVE